MKLLAEVPEMETERTWTAGFTIGVGKHIIT
jgi:hypothetical protein